MSLSRQSVVHDLFKEFTENLIKYLDRRFPNNSVLLALALFDPVEYSGKEEVDAWGEEAFETLRVYFTECLKEKKHRYDCHPQIDFEEAKLQLSVFKHEMWKLRPAAVEDWEAFLKSYVEQQLLSQLVRCGEVFGFSDEGYEGGDAPEGLKERVCKTAMHHINLMMPKLAPKQHLFSEMWKLALFCVQIQPTSVNCERVFSARAVMKRDWRTRLSAIRLNEGLIVKLNTLGSLEGGAMSKGAMAKYKSSTRMHFYTHIADKVENILRGPRFNRMRSAVRCVVAESLPSSLDAPCAVVSCAVRFYHLSETNDFKEFSEIVTQDVKWRQRGLLQGKQTHSGAEAVHTALLELHAAYQDLTFSVITYAEEEGRVAMFWTAVGTNRVGLFGMQPSFKRSTFSGVSLVQLNSEGRISEIIEYRQPTHEEMAAYLRRDLPGPQRATIERLLLRGHAAPAPASASSGASGSFCQLPSSSTIDPMWRVRAVQAATEWVENWTPGPDLENMVRDDIEEFNIYSWPDFEQDVVGRDALEERRSRNSQDAVIIRETIADSTTNVVVVHWFDFEQSQPMGFGYGDATGDAAGAGASAAAAKAAGAAPGVPQEALPRQQPTLHPEHGSVEVKNGHLRVHLSPSPTLRRSLGSEDDLGGPFSTGPRLHKYRGVTLFRLDEDCKLAWLVTFREMKATELDTYLSQKLPAAAI
ncbi:hypothetical protein VOLCADRAFT_121622 [Volvox carteri f. nagariensis]|uniref:SnoaL-like domain-containing protein n=1 Tax=Volvox carteri f. nagariensis TaxID=3068 RepID=D8UF94_VOLCA|nr:uncharacterized protein VOLCADRAFT_121622 [Volvox carteri f. nagariensis]EFJ41538.1 hypothetical protein VOLCADRAFT_121622 [Volvox carteri f. nagariensis]|eukprot:XP_002957329.1 hypothetical protein VOLCADRAFT_121622 [Volvox carteri f. nagariensis]